MKLQIWDTAGGEQFRSLTPMYYKNAAAVCLVYDSTCSDSFDKLDYWVKELQERGETSVMLNIVASKIDDDAREEVPLRQAGDYAKKNKADFFQTSAKDGTGIDELFTQIAEKLYTKMLAGETK